MRRLMRLLKMLLRIQIIEEKVWQPRVLCMQKKSQNARDAIKLCLLQDHQILKLMNYIAKLDTLVTERQRIIAN